MSSNEDIDYVIRVFPEIQQIKGAELARIVAEIWAEFWRESDWPAIEDVPKNPSTHGSISLAAHTRSVTRLAIQFAHVMREIHGIDRIRLDDLIAGSVLHDADKILFYSKAGDGVVKTRLPKQLPHGTYTGFRMMAKGLPLDLVNLVVAHSAKATYSVPITLEGEIMRQADRAESEVTKFATKEERGEAPGKAGKGGD
jgi:hypothetical protein